jgi:hypothetical protein
MASVISIDLGELRIKNESHRRLILGVSTTLTLKLSANNPQPLSTHELYDQVHAGELWISRAGSCRLQVDVEFDEDFEDMYILENYDIRQAFSNGLENCPVSLSVLLKHLWLGLDVARFGLPSN